MAVPAWASDFATRFYADVADVNSPAGYAARFVPDGDLYMRAPFKGRAQIEQCMAGFWARVSRSAHHSLAVFYNDAQPDTVFVNGRVDLDNADGSALKDIEFVARFTLDGGSDGDGDGDRKIKAYRVWTCECGPLQASLDALDALAALGPLAVWDGVAGGVLTEQKAEPGPGRPHSARLLRTRTPGRAHPASRNRIPYPHSVMMPFHS